jgi:hypothetical protein
MDRPGDLGGSDPWEDAEPCTSEVPEKLRERAVTMALEIRTRDGK